MTPLGRKRALLARKAVPRLRDQMEAIMTLDTTTAEALTRFPCNLNHHTGQLDPSYEAIVRHRSVRRR